MRRPLPIWLLVSLLVFALGSTACESIQQEDPVDFSYESQPVSIFNPDWGVLPLPNNFLNPVAQAEVVQVNIPGAPVPETMPVYMGLPLTDEAALEVRANKGYPAGEADSPLTLELLSGMNKLDGFVANIVPEFPFSREIDLETVKIYDPEVDEAGAVVGPKTNSSDETVGWTAEEANFFFLDITDPENPVTVNNYAMLFNARESSAMPYMLSVRDKALKDFQQGHTYLIVVTGITENGIKDPQGNPFAPDSFYMMFSSALPYVHPDGTLRNNLLSGEEAVWELEGARQITDYGLKVWETLAGETRSRGEVITSTSFTIMSNPYSEFFSAVNAVVQATTGSDLFVPMLPEPADMPMFDADGNLSLVKAEAATDSKIKFKVSQPLDADSVISENLKLYKMDDGAYTEIAAGIKLTNGEEDASITITPESALEEDTKYMVAMSNGVIGKNGRAAADQVFFGLTRVTEPIVDDKGMWQSPYLDSRIDSIVNGNTLEGAAGDVGKVLSMLELLRLEYKDAMSWLDEQNFVEERADLAMFWTFTTTDGAAE